MLLQGQPQWRSWWPSPSHHKKHTWHGGNPGTQGFGILKLLPKKSWWGEPTEVMISCTETSVGLLSNHIRQVKPSENIGPDWRDPDLSLYGNINLLQKSFVLNREENLEHVAYFPFYNINPQKTALQSQLFNLLLSQYILRGINVNWHLEWNKCIATHSSDSLMSWVQIYTSINWWLSITIGRKYKVKPHGIKMFLIDYSMHKELTYFCLYES